VHPRLQLVACGRPLNFTVRARIQDSSWKVTEKWELEPKTLRLAHPLSAAGSLTAHWSVSAVSSLIASLLPHAHSSSDGREL